MRTAGGGGQGPFLGGRRREGVVGGPAQGPRQAAAAGQHEQGAGPQALGPPPVPPQGAHRRPAELVNSRDSPGNW